jgi:hypothetical protein
MTTSGVTALNLTKTSQNVQRRKAKEARLDAKTLREVLAYDAATGVFRWLKTRGGRKSGSVAGNWRTDGYIMIAINGYDYLAHRLAWLYVHGEWPETEVDHKNLVRDDNRIDNLRPSSHSQNVTNVGKRVNNSSGYKGVSWHKGSKKWVSRISFNKKTIELGYYNDPVVAFSAYKDASQNLHKEFSRIY